MYFRSSIRRNPKTGNLSGYYRLIESYRGLQGRVCHRTLLSVGFLDELTEKQISAIQKGLNSRVSGLEQSLFPDAEPDPVVTKNIDKFYSQLKQENRLDIPSTKGSEKNWQTIDIDSIRNRDVRELGAEWLGYQAVKQLKIDRFLFDKGWAPAKVSLALAHMIGRAVYPASELKTSRWMQENSAVCEITGCDAKKITKDKLYSISHALYAEREPLEQYLSTKTDELFDIQDNIILYDLTNTYFEGRKKNSQIARFGRSKEKRSDARLVVLALVINPVGFIKYSAIYEGNKADCKTLPDMIDKLRRATSSSAKRALVIIDAGIATDKNLKLILEKGYDYLCVSRSKIKDYTIDLESKPVIVFDKKNQKIELCKINSPNSTDYFLRINSEAKKLKESAMNSRFKDRFEEGLVKIEASLHKKCGIKRHDRVHERIGRLKQRYPSIHRFYLIEVKSNEKNIATSLTWAIKQGTSPDQDSGEYFIRTSLKQTDEEIAWKSYNLIREIEYTIRVLKTDLDLRPIFHKNDDSTMAHLHLGLLAYTVVNTIRYQLKQKNIHSSWSEIVRIMNTQKCVTTIAQNNHDELIIIRKSSEPEPKAVQIYEALNYKHIPFTKKRSVVLKSEFQN